MSVKMYFPHLDAKNILLDISEFILKQVHFLLPTVLSVQETKLTKFNLNC